MSLRPIIAICGTTGVGKSKLAIELALAISNAFHHNERSNAIPYRGARIINADAMQVYAGMDILTNKVPSEEQCGVDHLLMGFKKPGEQYVVGQWIRDAMEAIEETHQRNQLPIVVGGTSYWIQHLIFPGRLVSSFNDSDSVQGDEDPASESATTTSDQLSQAIDATSPELLKIYDELPENLPSVGIDPEAAFSLHSLLSSLDPDVASRWHWKDTRKVLRSLHIIKQSGRLSSDIIHEQSNNTSEPRYRTLFLWLYARPEVLNPRLDTRVDEMMERGLLREVEELATIASTSSIDQNLDSASVLDYTLGIYQSIGYREFFQYLINSDKPNKDELYTDAVDHMKLSTRKYAKRQVRWIRNTLLPVVNTANAAATASGSLPPVPAYLLDATELDDAWKTNVQEMAEKITQDFLEEHELPDPFSLSDASRVMLSISEKSADPTTKLKARRKVVCPVCTVNDAQPVMIEEGREWQAHIGTRLHRRLTPKTEQLPDGPRAQDERRKRSKSSDEKSDDPDPNMSLLNN